MIRIRFFLFGALCFFLGSVALQAQQFSITNHQLVSSVRASLYQYDYTYQISAQNTGPNANSVDCVVTSTTPRTIIKSGNLNFGNMPSGSPSISTTTLVLRQDRRYSLNWASLQWQWSSVPVLSLSSLSPSTVYTGSAGITLTVNGRNFISGDTVEWNNSSLSTTFVSGTQLTATVPAGDIATQGSASVTVVNAAGGTSGSLSLFIVPPPVVQGATVTSTISPNGGTISVPIPGGQATLVIPANVFIGSTAISMTPLSKPPLTGISWFAGVQLEPQGLKFVQPVTLTFQLPSLPNPANTAALVFQDDGTQFYQDIAIVDGNVARIQVLHFTDYGVGSFPCSVSLAGDPSWMPEAIASQEIAYEYYCVSDPEMQRINDIAFMTSWFNNSILPGLQNATDLSLFKPAAREYLWWLKKSDFLIESEIIGPHDLDTLEESGNGAFLVGLAKFDADEDTACVCSTDPTERLKHMNNLISLQALLDKLAGSGLYLDSLVRTLSSLCKPYTQVAFEEPAVSLQVGQGENLSEVFDPNRIPPGSTVQWASSLPAIADLTSASFETFITGESQGKTSLTVTVTQCADAPVSGSIPVTVNPRTASCQPLAPLQLLKSNLTLTTGQSVSVSQVLDSSQFPAGTVVAWQSDQPRRVSVDNGTIKAEWPGPPVTLTVIANSQCGAPQSASIIVTVNPVQPTNYYTLNWTAGTVGGRTFSEAYSGNLYSASYKINSTWSGKATFDSTGKCLSVSTSGFYDLVDNSTACGPGGCISISNNLASEITAPALLQDILEILPILQDDQGPYMVDPLLYAVSDRSSAIVDTSSTNVRTEIVTGYYGGGSYTWKDSWDSQGIFISYVGPNVLRPDFATGKIFSKDYESTDETSGLTTFWNVRVTVEPQQ